jgi:hypothetical protein
MRPKEQNTPRRRLDELLPLARAGILPPEDGSRYQADLAQFIAVGCENKDSVAGAGRTWVETGSGISTLFLADKLRPLDRLYTVDCAPVCGYMLDHPRVEWVLASSRMALPEIYIKTGPWDFFLHDSDHEKPCQTFEYEFAYGCLKPGGWIFSDDIEWAQHFAWRKFTERYRLKTLKIGHAEGACKETQSCWSPAECKRIADSLWKAAAG